MAVVDPSPTIETFGVPFDGRCTLPVPYILTFGIPPDPSIRLVASIQEYGQCHIRFSYPKLIGESVTVSGLGGCGDCFVRMPEKGA